MSRLRQTRSRVAPAEMAWRRSNTSTSVVSNAPVQVATPGGSMRPLRRSSYWSPQIAAHLAKSRRPGCGPFLRIAHIAPHRPQASNDRQAADRHHGVEHDLQNLIHDHRRRSLAVMGSGLWRINDRPPAPSVQPGSRLRTRDAGFAKASSPAWRPARLSDEPQLQRDWSRRPDTGEQAAFRAAWGPVARSGYSLGQDECRVDDIHRRVVTG